MASLESCTPIFPSLRLPPPRRKAFLDDSSSLDETLSDDGATPRQGYIERLAEQYRKMASLPSELEPPSRPTSPGLSTRATDLQGLILRAVEDSHFEPSHPKWGHVSRLVRMASTSRRRGAAPGVRVGEKVEVDVGDYVFVMPDTEEGWEECERRWAARKLNAPAATSRDAKGKGKARETKSKYWSNGPAKKPRLSAEVLREEEEDPVSKEDRVTNRVLSWQAEVVRAELPEVPTVETPVSAVAVVAKTNMAKPVPRPKRQSPLEFPVVKHAGPSNSGKPGRGMQESKSVPSQPEADVEMLSPERPKTPPSVKEVPEPMDISSPMGIADISEASFLPPSFPSHLETSTPKDAEKVKQGSITEKHKPAPIYPRPFLYSSPPSPPPSHTSPFSPARPGQYSPQRLGMSSSLPIISPSARIRTKGESRPLKRSRPLTPPDDDVFVTGVSKKIRTDAPNDNERLTSSAPLPPSSPPVVTPPLSKPNSPPQRVGLVRTGSGLGNAKGLPVPETPNRKELPCLTDLLASSRRSKPRPRPPSRKTKLSKDSIIPDDGGESSNHNPDPPHKDVLPTLQDDEDAIPEVSPAKTYFSSPASGSSQSTPQSLKRRPRSPISPLFGTGGLGIGRFSPQFTSTQRRDAAGSSLSQSIFRRGFGAHQESQHSQSSAPGLVKGSSGMFGMYNSQFDVEAQVGHVSDLLDRDVDFGEFLKDLGEVEEEDVDAQQDEEVEV
ncbi:hypothetical protein BXZ70DRAFT_186919 [Cristinia sonorae]|uniref:Uncharacterized protein n=1 Tax=Cristinia sonorae TaxID=1940300 RepID=A0A8K0UQA8_9AGAR|nr:hypothetical protein BXZ70DRAFT_186919 [Cristinia sonorae]